MEKPSVRRATGMKEKDWALSRSALLFFWKRDGQKSGSAALVRPLNTKVTTHISIKTQSVPRSKHSVSVIQTIQLMLYRVIMAVCSEIHTKHTNILCGQNGELLNVKLVVHIVTTGV
jgi:hypothetical protein